MCCGSHLYLRNARLLAGDQNPAALVVEGVRVFDAHIGDLLRRLVGLKIDARARTRSVRIREGGVQDQQSIHLDDRQPLPAVGVGGHSAESHVLGARHIKTVAPHILCSQPADGDVFGVIVDADAPPAAPALPRC
jgi:hypothetical protein